MSLLGVRIVRIFFFLYCASCFLIYIQILMDNVVSTMRRHPKNFEMKKHSRRSVDNNLTDNKHRALIFN